MSFYSREAIRVVNGPGTIKCELKFWAPPFISCVNIGKLLNLSGPRFFSLADLERNNDYLKELVGGFYKSTSKWHLAWGRLQRKSSGTFG